MTTLGLDYLRNLEQRRHNLIDEAENLRSHKRSEELTAADIAEKSTHNRNDEAIKARSVAEDETHHRNEEAQKRAELGEKTEHDTQSRNITISKNYAAEHEQLLRDYLNASPNDRVTLVEPLVHKTVQAYKAEGLTGQMLTDSLNRFISEISRNASEEVKKEIFGVASKIGLDIFGNITSLLGRTASTVLSAASGGISGHSGGGGKISPAGSGKSIR